MSINNWLLTHQKQIQNYLFITLGTFLSSSAVRLCFSPHRISPGGTPGVAIFLNVVFGISLAASTLIFNLLMIGLATLFLGRGFGIKAVYVLLITALFLAVIPELNLFKSAWLAAMVGSIAAGGGIALVVRNQGSSGGTLTIAQIISKYARIPLPWCMLVVDCVVILLMLAAVRKLETLALSGISVVTISLVVKLLTRNR